MVNGEKLTGSKGWAGELGFSPVGKKYSIEEESDDEFDENDDSKKRVFLDHSTSGKWLVKACGFDSGEAMHDALQKDETIKAKCYKKSRIFGRNLGTTVAMLLNVFNPDAIIFGGGTLKWNGYWDGVIKNIKKYSLPQSFEACKVLKISDYVEKLNGFGAAISNFEEFSKLSD